LWENEASTVAGKSNPSPLRLSRENSLEENPSGRETLMLNYSEIAVLKKMYFCPSDFIADV
jgi:hypothetical protein